MAAALSASAICVADFLLGLAAAVRRLHLIITLCCTSASPLCAGADIKHGFPTLVPQQDSCPTHTKQQISTEPPAIEHEIRRPAPAPVIVVFRGPHLNGT
eukprot:6213250-Pleurochrysis_carterae.AAC.1